MSINRPEPGETDEDMTVQEALAKSAALQAAAYDAIFGRAPEPVKRAALSAYIQFNPYMYPLSQWKHD
jgi:endonuclease V-like protein UPF0215 family